MGVSRLWIIAASVILTVWSFKSEAGPLMDCGLNKQHCETLLGRRLWIVVPKSNPNAVEVHPVKGDYTTANSWKFKTGSFLVESVSLDKSGYDYDLAVRLPDGRRGFVTAGFSWIFLSENDPVEDAKKAAAAVEARRVECEHRGQPRIGMNHEEVVASCWGKPQRVVIKTTAAGVEKTYIYGLGHMIRFSDGIVSEIIQTR